MSSSGLGALFTGGPAAWMTISPAASSAGRTGRYIRLAVRIGRPSEDVFPFRLDEARRPPVRNKRVAPLPGREEMGAITSSPQSRQRLARLARRAAAGVALRQALQQPHGLARADALQRLD